MDLPPEIRQLIYKACFLVDDELHLDYKLERRHNTSDWKAHKPLINVAFLQTCKTVHDEATPILYGRNKFVLLGWPSRWTWIQAFFGIVIKDVIGPTPRQHIANVRIDMTALDERSVNWAPVIWPCGADMRLWNLVNTRFLQLKTIDLTFGSVSSKGGGGEHPNCFATVIAHDLILLRRQKLVPDTTQITLTATVVEGPRGSKEPFVYVPPERQAVYPPCTPEHHQVNMAKMLAAEVVHVSHPADTTRLRFLTPHNRWDRYAFCPTNLPADGVYPVGSKVELVWRLPDCELELEGKK